MAGKMRPIHRYDWIENYMRNDKGAQAGVDVLDREFVDSYIDATGSSYIGVMWGAHKCPQLGADLRAMYDRGILRRARLGLSGGAWQPGFPKWVWSYRLRFL